MADTKTIRVSHLGGIDAGYQMLKPFDASKPTLVMVNSFTTNSDLYKSQFANNDLSSAMNLIAIELLGHGRTRARVDNWTYWDTAYMNLQVLDALGIKGKIFVLGTSQGGWITARMALLAPEKITGIIPVGTSMDRESERTRKLNCWDVSGLTPNIEEWTSKDPTPEFEPTDGYCNFLIDLGFGKECPADTRQFWVKAIQNSYKGDDGRRRLRMAAINLRDRDGLHPRLFDIHCPILWMHGTADPVYSVANAQEEIKLFVNSPDAQVKVIDQGEHFLSFSHPKEVDTALLEFVTKYSK